MSANSLVTFAGTAVCAAASWATTPHAAMVARAMPFNFISCVLPRRAIGGEPLSDATRGSPRVGHAIWNADAAKSAAREEQPWMPCQRAVDGGHPLAVA